MHSDNAKFFTDGFKTKTIQQLQLARPVFCREMFRATVEQIKVDPHHYSRNEIHPGFRFFNDEQCWHAFVVLCFKYRDWIMAHESKVRFFAGEIEREFDLDREDYKAKVWLALNEAANTDYHYEYEKDY